MKCCKQKEQGFTLIEMMIVVVLIAILAAIALPAYGNYVNRAKVKAIQADLVALSLNFENAYQRKLTYPTAYANTSALTTDFSGWSPASEGFAFSSAVVSGDGGYTLKATGGSASGALVGCVISFTQGGGKLIASCSASLGVNGGWL